MAAPPTPAPIPAFAPTEREGDAGPGPSPGIGEDEDVGALVTDVASNVELAKLVACEEMEEEVASRLALLTVQKVGLAVLSAREAGATAPVFGSTKKSSPF